MTSTAPLDRLQKIADYRTTCKFLRKNGVGEMAFGFALSLNGAFAFQNRLVDYLYLAIATIVLLNGLRNRLHPSAFGRVMNGSMMILLGAWNLTIQFLWLGQGAPIAFNFGAPAIFDVFVICFGIREILRYPQARAVFRDPPTPEQIHWFDDLIAEIQSAKAGETPDLVEFTSGIRWRGRRLAEIAVFVDKNDLETLIVDRHDIEILSDRKALLRSARQVKLRIGRRTFALAVFSPEMLSVLESWLGDDEQMEPAEMDEPELMRE
jgi:hypothetical protein